MDSRPLGCEWLLEPEAEGHGVERSAVDGRWVKSFGAKDQVASDELWRHQGALLLRTFRQPLGRAQSAERGSPNHSPRCPTGAQGKGAL